MTKGKKRNAYIVQIGKIKLKWTEVLGAEKIPQSINNHQELPPETFLSHSLRTIASVQQGETGNGRDVCKQKDVSEPPSSLNRCSGMKEQMESTKRAFQENVVASKNTDMLKLTHGELFNY